MNTKNAKEMALIWSIPVNQITRYCREGRIPGAVKVKNTWWIPEEAKKPADNRRGSAAGASVF